MKRFRSILFLLAAALLFGTVPARALLVSVDVWWGNNGGSIDPHIQVGSIIQFVAYNHSTSGAPYTTDPLDPDDHFQPYGDSYLPDTVVTPGHVIIATGKVQDLGDGVYGLSTGIDLPYPYDSLYVRVFSATQFDPDNPTDSWWGVSVASNIVDNGMGMAITWFDDTPLTASNTFELIPEPSSLAFLLSGGCGMGVFSLFRRRRKLRSPEE